MENNNGITIPEQSAHALKINILQVTGINPVDLIMSGGGVMPFNPTPELLEVRNTSRPVVLVCDDGVGDIFAEVPATKFGDFEGCHGFTCSTCLMYNGMVLKINCSLYADPGYGLVAAVVEPVPVAMPE